MRKYLLLLLCALLSIGASAQVSDSGPRKASANGHEYVDLGLPSGTLWATHNIGATNPEDYGDYFAWGETEGYNSGKTDFDWSTYKYCNGDYNKLTKYCNSSGFGTVDNKTELEFSDDAAYVNWGINWRMPSIGQFSELINSSYTTTTWTTVNGVYGRKITSKSNGNSIFLPAAGCRDDTSLIYAGSYGLYWSRTLDTSYPHYARSLDFNSSNIYTRYNSRYYGRSVRPVLASILLVETITLTPASLALAAGATSQLTATVTPSCADNPVLTWSSSDTEVAVVGTDGRVVAVAPGTAVITCAATDGSGVKATCQVTVTAAAATAHEYVDLGLPSGTLWATCNIGASSPEDYGDYFAWGETSGYNSGKTTFNWSTYKYCNGYSSTLTKY
ncbi:MAG: Ig-like domain-containing protein, partial [Bacteroidaceae bacterium]|nr:Ig-like domain-containing protein [Bacteroidaceae bacterium]